MAGRRRGPCLDSRERHVRGFLGVYTKAGMLPARSKSRHCFQSLSAKKKKKTKTKELTQCNLPHQQPSGLFEKQQTSCLKYIVIENPLT